jgi:hypothetical protein
MDQSTVTLISTGNLSESTGLSMRQLDYLITAGVIAVAKGGQGSGSHRQIDADYIPALVTIRQVSNALAESRGGITTDIMRRIVLEHDQGCIELTDGISVCWEL